MKTIEYLRAAKRALKIESDYALAKHLGITKASVSLLMSGQTGTMSNTTAAQVAEILGVDPLKVIADMELERGTNDELWRRIARRAAAVVLPVSLIGAATLPSPAEATVLQRGEGPLCYVKLPVWVEKLLQAAYKAGLAAAALSLGRTPDDAGMFT